MTILEECNAGDEVSFSFMNGDCIENQNIVDVNNEDGFIDLQLQFNVVEE